MSFAAASAGVEKARLAQREWRKTPLADRVNIVAAAVRHLAAAKDDIALELAWMMGRPLRYGGGELNGVAERVTYMSAIAEDALKPVVHEHGAAFERRIEREPHGVVLVIAPWNYPYLTAINTVAPALIAGNAVVIKPATQTLLTGERLVNAFVAAGVPVAVFQNMFLSHDTTNALIASKQFGFINFTGSVAGGKSIEQAAAGTFTGVGLELGGKDPGYVMEDADVGAAAEALMDAAMFNSGQCCCGIERIYVAASRYDDFVEKATAVVKQLTLGDPLRRETTLGPMAQPRFAELVRAHVREAVAAGATAHIPAMAADDDGAYLSPQLLTRVNHEMRVMVEESFGPVVGVMKVRDDDEAVALMNDSAYGLTASLWGVDAERAAAVAARLETGTVFMNRADYLDPALCWSGCKNSGRGGALSFIGYQHLTRPKSLHFKKQ